MLLVDAYNVLHTTGILPPHLAGVDVDGLADLIAASRFGRRHVALVCDGRAPRPTPRPPTGASIEILFAGAGKDADSLIEHLLHTRGRGGGHGVTIVSTDRRLQRSARKRKAKWMTSETFLAILAEDHAGPVPPGRGGRPRPADRPPFATDLPLDPSSVEVWLRELGIRPEDEIMRLAASAGRAISTAETPRPATPAVSPPRPASTAREPRPPVDPLLLEALKEWPGRLTLDDLDMSRWLKD